MTQPRADDLDEVLAREPVVAGAPLAPHLDEAGVLEHLEVARRRRPRVGEARGELPRRELVSALREEREDVPAHLVREREKHGVELGSGGLRHRRAFY